MRNVYAKIITIGQGVWPCPCGRHTDKMPNARSNNENSLRLAIYLHKLKVYVFCHDLNKIQSFTRPR